MAAQEIGHVLDDAEHRRSNLREHVEAFVGASGTGWAIVNCALRVPGGMSMTMMSSSPINLTQHLLQRAHDHRGAPDYRRLLGHEKTKTRRHAAQP
jgi:hypothetical protein